MIVIVMLMVMHFILVYSEEEITIWTISLIVLPLLFKHLRKWITAIAVAADAAAVEMNF